MRSPPSPGSTAVPAYLPLGFIAAGIVSFLWVAVEFISALPDAVLYVRHNRVLLVLVHLFTLTWGSGVTLGVLHQMTPVIVSARLHSVRMGWLSLGLFVPGSLLLAFSFRFFWLIGVAAGGIIVIMGTLVFSANMIRTLRAAGHYDVTQRYLAVSIAAFVGTLFAGLTMAISLRFGGGLNIVDPILAIHLLLGVTGWFSGMIIGVSYRLFPMFLLVHGHDERPAKHIFNAIYGGVFLGIIGVLWGRESALLLPGIALIGAGMILYARDLGRMWRSRGRRPDVWMKQTVWAVAYGVLGTMGGIVAVVWAVVYGQVVPARFMLALGLLFSMGWISTMIVALLHKIVPFLVWYHRYGDLVGQEKVPAMSDLTNQRLGAIVFPIYHVMLILMTIFVGAGRIGPAMLAAGGFAVSVVLLVFDLLLLIIPVRIRMTQVRESLVR